MMVATRNNTTLKRAFGLGTCLCLILALAMVVTFSVDAVAGVPSVKEVKAAAAELASSVEEGVKKKDTGDLSINDPEFDWNYALYTLIIRFVGIFIVLGVIQVIMQISGRLFVRYEEKKKAQAAN